MSPAVLPLSLGVVFALAAVAPVLSRALGRNTGYPLAAGFTAVTALLALQAPRVIRGEAISARIGWLPSLDLGLGLGLDGLSLLFALLVTGIGAIVLAYSARYLKPGGHGRFYGMLVFFAGSMLGLVLASDLIALFVFWELTSVSSFFLIGGVGGEAAKKPAMRAFLVTGLGGLALFAGIVLLGVAAGSFELAEIVAGADTVRAHAFATPALALLLLGAFTKSAMVPFHFWLPGAMVAPTPISTYLHAATMVKAGIYLLARIAPVFAGDAVWLYTLVGVGLLTAVFGAVVALKQYDLKALLAYSTVSQLGFIVALIGVGTPLALKAAALHILAHAAYKATLFMVVGIIDVEAGSRDIRDLSGLRKAMPVTATVTGLAALSMAGIPPVLGFVSKEEAFASFLAAPGAAWFAPAAAAAAVTAAVATFGYGARILEGAFGGPLVQRLYEPPRSFILPAAITALAGAALGVTVPALDGFVGRVASDALALPVEARLTLWHGFNAPLLLSAVTVAAGLTVFFARRRVDRLLDHAKLRVRGDRSFDRLYEAALRAGREAARPFAVTAPGIHFLWVLALTGATATLAWAVLGEPLALPAPPSLLEDWFVLGLLVLAGLAIALTRQRLAAVAVLGIAGFVVALFYVVLGAPDLAITQLLIETLTVTLIVLVFRRLPRGVFHAVAGWRRWGAGLVALAAGTLAAGGTYELTGHRELSPAGAYFLEAAPKEAGGDNVVNTILVDFRALDTLGEITVLAVAALGVYALVRLVRSNGTDPKGDGP